MEVAKCPCGKWQVEISAGIGMFTARSKVTLFRICFTNVCFMLELTGWKLEGALEREDLYPVTLNRIDMFQVFLVHITWQLQLSSAGTASLFATDKT